MEKILTLKGVKDKEYKIKLKSTAASLIHYKRQFNKDGMSDMFKLTAGETADLDIENLDLEVFYRFLWCFAYSADKSILPFEEWLDSFDILPIDFITQALPTVIDLLADNVKTSVKKK